MDAQELWQDNKRWILWVLLGVVVWWIADSLIQGSLGAGATVRKIRQDAKLGDEELYGKEALAAAKEEEQALTAARATLDEALLFAPGDEFTLAGKGDPDLYFDQVSRRVKRDLVALADATGIELADKDLDWAAPVGRDEIQATLIGVALVEQAARRLLAAHAQVRAARPDALGLLAIDQLQVVAVRERPSPRPRGSKPGVPDPQDLLREERVRFKVRCDEATLSLFLEACRQQSPRVTLAPDFKVALGRASGDPLVVTGTLTALRFLTS